MIKALYAPMEEMEAFVQIRRRMQNKLSHGMILLGGCIDSQKAHMIGCLARDYPVTCILAPDDLRAKEICENYRVFDENVLLYPVMKMCCSIPHVISCSSRRTLRAVP